MVSIGVFHSGHTNLPLTKAANGEVIPDASLSELHADQQQILRDQVEHGILAEELGFDRNTFLEHHFPAAANEFSPNPLFSQMAIATQTDEIRLLQMANILPWHDPIRLAEQTAMLDVLSDGRVEVGIGRGYQPKENEVLGQYWGGTVQDEEKNRTAFKEKLEILQQAWTEDIFSYHGEFHQIPPSFTRWHHTGEYTYFDSDKVPEYDGDDLINWKDVDLDPDEIDNPVMEAGSTLNSVFVAPKPVQKPHPQVWEPVSSPRSIKFAASRGINGYLTSGSPPLVNRLLDAYMDAVEEAGWPDYREEYDGEPFKFGWDGDRQRGMCPLRVVFNTDIVEEEAVDRFKAGLEHKYAFYGPFGINSAALDMGDDVPIDFQPDADLLLEKKVAFIGDSEELVDQIAQFKEDCGFEDFIMDIGFDMSGISGDETMDQMRTFADEVMPYLREEFAA